CHGEPDRQARGHVLGAGASLFRLEGADIPRRDAPYPDPLQRGGARGAGGGRRAEGTGAGHRPGELCHIEFPARGDRRLVELLRPRPDLAGGAAAARRLSTPAAVQPRPFAPPARRRQGRGGREGIGRDDRRCLHPRGAEARRARQPGRGRNRARLSGTGACGMTEADYVVVGAGSAGCAMAYRLAEAGRSGLVIEPGGSDVGPFIQMPGALSYPMNMGIYDWGFRTEPEPHLGGRTLATPRGKVIGGSSSINGMVFVRGHAKDFDHWAESGAAGWAYADVLPYFRRMETWHGGDGGAFRGTDGPLHVTRGARRNPLFHAFVEAGRQAGYEVTADYNGEKQEGFGPMEATIWRGRRWSAANAYLKPAMKRPNCRLIRALARRVVLDAGRAVGVEVERGGQVEVIRARAEVILAASSINTPKLLMLSGVGPARHLSEHGIAVVADRPGVGANLQDHLEVYMQYASQKPITLYKYWNLWGKAMVGAQWLFTGTGLGASNQFESAAFIR